MLNSIDSLTCMCRHSRPRRNAVKARRYVMKTTGGLAPPTEPPEGRHSMRFLFLALDVTGGPDQLFQCKYFDCLRCKHALDNSCAKITKKSKGFSELTSRVTTYLERLTCI